MSWLTKAFLFRVKEWFHCIASRWSYVSLYHLLIVWYLFWSTLRRSCTAKLPLCSLTAQSQGLDAGSLYMTSGSWVSNSWPPPTLICLWRVRSMCSWHTSWSVRVKPKMTDFRCCLVFYNSLINGCIFDIVYIVVRWSTIEDVVRCHCADYIHYCTMVPN